MKRGEKIVFGLIALVVLATITRNVVTLETQTKPDPGIPFYTTATPQLAQAGALLYRNQQCRECHSLWSVRNMMESVPAPALDGIGSLRTEEWLYDYLSSPNPQTILQSRMKVEYRMPSYAALPEADRRTLVRYLASLKVQDWYLEDTRKAEYEKRTGLDYHP
jgi:sulfur-oxidizing protein SoxX